MMNERDHINYAKSELRNYMYLLNVCHGFESKIIELETLLEGMKSTAAVYGEVSLVQSLRSRFFEKSITSILVSMITFGGAGLSIIITSRNQREKVEIEKEIKKMDYNKSQEFLLRKNIYNFLHVLNLSRLLTSKCIELENELTDNGFSKETEALSKKYNDDNENFREQMLELLTEINIVLYSFENKDDSILEDSLLCTHGVSEYNKFLLDPSPSAVKGRFLFSNYDIESEEEIIYTAYDLRELGDDIKKRLKKVASLSAKTT